ncbi:MULTISPECIES: ABC transporter substrate-binding protein [unclassified Roseitalea]|uniref:ABC transporter substrate-binding protein n=1 Tax=unclassified Roseitalea TaxID=2639107 RepID=UPI00273D4E19|nr:MULTISPECIES: ABC transporter substrate-binding protein [unclassified Roseitalea]
MHLKTLGAALALSTCIVAGAQAATLDIAVDSSPAGLDPHLITAFNSVVIVGDTVYEGLTMIAEDLSVQPALASSWEVSDDGLNYTFELEEGVTFHDGSAMTAEDVAASLRRVLSEEVASPLASRISPITDITVVDDTTISLTLDAPFAPILTSLAGIAIVPAEMESDVESLQQTPVGTGPFRFNEWKPNGYVSLVGFDDYRQEGLPKVDEVRFNIVPEAATRQVGLSSGQFEILPGVDPATALQLQAAPSVTVHETRELSYTLVGMNAERAPFDQAVVRRAFNMALDRGEIIQGALFGAGVPAGPLSPALVNWAVDTDSFDCYASDPEAARAMLEEAGIELPIELSMNVLPRQDVKDIAQVVQQQAAEAGFEIELLNQEIGQFVQDWRNSNFDLFASANGGNPDPDGYFYRTFYGGGSTNVFKYDDAEINRLLDEGRTTTDAAARKAAYDAIQNKLACEGPIAHIAYGTLATAVHDSVEGFEINPNRRLTSLKQVSLSE